MKKLFVLSVMVLLLFSACEDTMSSPFSTTRVGLLTLYTAPLSGALNS